MKSTTPLKLRKKHEPVEARLLGTAGRCFIEEGFGFGIDDILDQSDVAKMSLFVKFQSKYGLIERLLEIAHDQWLEEISRASKAFCSWSTATWLWSRCWARRRRSDWFWRRPRRWLVPDPASARPASRGFASPAS